MLLGTGLHVWLWITLRKSLSLVPAVGRQCRPQNLNRGCAGQWEVTYGPSVFQMSEFCANFCKDACERPKKPNTTVFFVIPCNKRWRDDRQPFSLPVFYMYFCFSKGSPMQLATELKYENCPLGSLNSLWHFPFRAKKQNQRKQFLYKGGMCIPYLHGLHRLTEYGAAFAQ